MNKRILFGFCSMELGGAERQGMHLARYLKSLGWDVRVWSCMEETGRVSEMCDELGIPWEYHRFRSPCRRKSLLVDGWNLLRALWRIRPDVIINYTTWPNVGGGLVWRWSPAKVCVWGQRNVNCLNGDWVERRAYRKSSAVVCNAAHMVDYLEEVLGRTPAPVHVVHNGLHMAPPLRGRTEWRADLGIDGSAVVATMIANFRAQKDHATLLRSWKKMREEKTDEFAQAHLLLAGAPQQTYENVCRLRQDLGLSETVHILDQVKDVSGLLAASDIGLLVSKYEGLSNSLIEYMASGLPVIATDHPGNREALGNVEGQEFCVNEDVDSLCERLKQFVNDPELREKIGAQNRRRAEAEFSIEKMCESNTNIISDLLQKANGGK